LIARRRIRQVAALVALAVGCAAGGWYARELPWWRTARSADTRQDMESPKIIALRDELRRGNVGAVGRFWSEAGGHGPIVEPRPGDPSRSQVTFLWRGDGGTRNVAVVGGPPPMQEKPRLTHLDGSDLWYRTEVVPNDARIAYWFHVNVPDGPPPRTREEYDKFIKACPALPDPQNPNRIGDRSLLELPAAVPQPWIKPRPDVAQRPMKEHTLHSAALGEDRNFAVYVPPGYDAKGAPCGLLVAFDGDGLPEDPTTLDNLIAAGRIPPLVGVFVRQRDRSHELTCSPTFVKFLADELVPWVRANYAVNADPKRAIVRGLSLGGLMASYCAFERPDVFGNVLSQSGSYQWLPEADMTSSALPPVAAEPGWLTRQYVAAPKRDVTFYLEAGRFEDISHNGLLTENRRLRDVLRAKGYTVHYSEFTGGHDPANWRGSFADGLLALVGTTPTSTKPF
jgi:enterochelin esterase family protein